MEKKPGKKRANFDDLSDVITSQELSQFLGVSGRLISKLVMKDEIKSFKFGTCRLFLKQDVADMIEYCEEKERQMKENGAKVYPGIPEEKEKGIVKVNNVPRIRTRGYEAIEIGD